MPPAQESVTGNISVNNVNRQPDSNDHVTKPSVLDVEQAGGQVEVSAKRLRLAYRIGQRGWSDADLSQHVVSGISDEGDVGYISDGGQRIQIIDMHGSRVLSSTSFSDQITCACFYIYSNVMLTSEPSLSNRHLRIHDNISNDNTTDHEETHDPPRRISFTGKLRRLLVVGLRSSGLALVDVASGRVVRRIRPPVASRDHQASPSFTTTTMLYPLSPLQSLANPIAVGTHSRGLFIVDLSFIAPSASLIPSDAVMDTIPAASDDNTPASNAVIRMLRDHADRHPCVSLHPEQRLYFHHKHVPLRGITVSSVLPVLEERLICVGYSCGVMQLFAVDDNLQLVAGLVIGSAHTHAQDRDSRSPYRRPEPVSRMVEVGVAAEMGLESYVWAVQESGMVLLEVKEEPSVEDSTVGHLSLAVVDHLSFTSHQHQYQYQHQHYSSRHTRGLGPVICAQQLPITDAIPSELTDGSPTATTTATGETGAAAASSPAGSPDYTVDPARAVFIHATAGRGGHQHGAEVRVFDINEWLVSRSAATAFVSYPCRRLASTRPLLTAALLHHRQTPYPSQQSSPSWCRSVEPDRMPSSAPSSSYQHQHQHRYRYQPQQFLSFAMAVLSPAALYTIEFTSPAAALAHEIAVEGALAFDDTDEDSADAFHGRVQRAIAAGMNSFPLEPPSPSDTPTEDPLHLLLDAAVGAGLTSAISEYVIAPQPSSASSSPLPSSSSLSLSLSASSPSPSGMGIPGHHHQLHRGPSSSSSSNNAGLTNLLLRDPIRVLLWVQKRLDHAVQEIDARLKPHLRKDGRRSLEPNTVRSLDARLSAIASSKLHPLLSVTIALRSRVLPADTHSLAALTTLQSRIAAEMEYVKVAAFFIRHGLLPAGAGLYDPVHFQEIYHQRREHRAMLVSNRDHVVGLERVCRANQHMREELELSPAAQYLFADRLRRECMLQKDDGQHDRHSTDADTNDESLSNDQSGIFPFPSIEVLLSMFRHPHNSNSSDHHHQDNNDALQTDKDSRPINRDGNDRLAWAHRTCFLFLLDLLSDTTAPLSHLHLHNLHYPSSSPDHQLHGQQAADALLRSYGDTFGISKTWQRFLCGMRLLDTGNVDPIPDAAAFLATVPDQRPTCPEAWIQDIVAVTLALSMAPDSVEQPEEAWGLLRALHPSSPSLRIAVLLANGAITDAFTFQRAFHPQPSRRRGLLFLIFTELVSSNQFRDLFSFPFDPFEDHALTAFLASYPNLSSLLIAYHSLRGRHAVARRLLHRVTAEEQPPLASSAGNESEERDIREELSFIRMALKNIRMALPTPYFTLSRYQQHGSRLRHRHHQCRRYRRYPPEETEGIRRRRRKGDDGSDDKEQGMVQVIHGEDETGSETIHLGDSDDNDEHGQDNPDDDHNMDTADDMDDRTNQRTHPIQSNVSPNQFDPHANIERHSDTNMNTNNNNNNNNNNNINQDDDDDSFEDWDAEINSGSQDTNTPTPTLSSRSRTMNQPSSQFANINPGQQRGGMTTITPEMMKQMGAGFTMPKPTISTPNEGEEEDNPFAGISDDDDDDDNNDNNDNNNNSP